MSGALHALPLPSPSSETNFPDRPMHQKEKPRHAAAFHSKKLADQSARRQAHITAIVMVALIEQVERAVARIVLAVTADQALVLAAQVELQAAENRQIV